MCHERLVAQQDHISGQGPVPREFRSVLRIERFLELAYECQNQHREGGQENEHGLPADVVGYYAAQYRRGCGCKSVDGADYGHEPGQLAAMEYVGGNGARQEIAARCAHALHETAHQKEYHGFGKNGYHGPGYEYEHGYDQHRFTPVAVGDGAEQQLTDGQSDHAHCQRELRLRGRAVEVAGYLRQRRRVHVVDKRAQGA